MRKHILTLLFFFALILPGIAQRSDTTGSKLFTKKNIVIGAIAYQQVAGALMEYAWWWIDSLRPLHFQNDQFWNNYSLGMDKFGHFYISYLTFTAINEAMRWAEFTPRQRLLTATILPAFWALSIEIGDGLSPYGFSTEDLISNFAGIGYGLLQEKVPYFHNFTYKFSFWPTQVYLGGWPQKWSPTSDYNAHTYWLCVNMHNVLPKPVGRYWPEIINLAVGYSITDRETFPKRELMLGIDINLRALKTKSAGVTALRNVANLIHLPSPGVKVTKEHTPDYRWLLLH
jgi:hypothetical protein